MTTFGQMPKPDAEQYKGRRKLFLVPTFMLPSNMPEEGQKLLDRYWSEVRDHIHNLERSLGSVSHIFHEALFSDDDEGMKLLESVNPKGYQFIQVMCQSTARLAATDDKTVVEEGADWQRCLGMGLISEKVRSTALEGYQEAIRRRYEHITARLDEVLKEDEVGVLFIHEDHRVQFPSDIQVFFVAPPALEALKRWFDEQMRAVVESVQKEPGPDEPDKDKEDEEEQHGPSEDSDKHDE